MTMESKCIKIALRRDESVPMGQPAPLHMVCLCGQRLNVTSGNSVLCECGRAWSSSGWLLFARP